MNAIKDTPGMALTAQVRLIILTVKNGINDTSMICLIVIVCKSM